MKKLTFTQLVAQMPYPPAVKGKLTDMHSAVVTAVIHSFRNTRNYKNSVLKILNALTYCAVNNIDASTIWLPVHPLAVMDADWLEFDIMKPALGDLFIEYDEVTWDVEEVDLEEPTEVAVVPQREIELAPKHVSPKLSDEPTPKSHLYLGPRMFPQFDITKPWLHAIVDNEPFTIYTSLPEIPTNQAEITITTDASKLTDADRMRLFPNRVAHTRPKEMYERIEGIPYDENLGLIIPIEGFTEEQVKKNIIEYPHFYRLGRLIDDQIQSFHAKIEVNGELLDPTQREVWSSFKDLEKLPFVEGVLKEYVVRRYLLEGDILGVEHKYPMFGILGKFLTMFMPPDMYKQYGYDPLSVAATCVESRISFFRSRNPMLRRVLAAQSR